MIELGFISGIIGGLFGVFFRSCMKVKNMIFNPYYRILSKWVNKKDKNKFESFLGWIAYPIGYCIYCTTTWITIFISIIFLSQFNSLPDWRNIVLLLVTSLGVQHFIVAMSCRFLLSNHPDLSDTIDNENEEG